MTAENDVQSLLSRRALLAAAAISVMFQAPESQAKPKDHGMKNSTFYRTVNIDGTSIFYREAGPKDAAHATEQTYPKPKFTS